MHKRWMVEASLANCDVEEPRLEFEETRTEVPTLDIGLAGFGSGEVDRIFRQTT